MVASKLIDERDNQSTHIAMKNRWYQVPHNKLAIITGPAQLMLTSLYDSPKVDLASKNDIQYENCQLWHRTLKGVRQAAEVSLSYHRQLLTIM